MAYQKLQPERAYSIPKDTNFNIAKDNPFINITQILVQDVNFSIDVVGGAVDTVTMLKPINGNTLTGLPTVTISTLSGGGSGAVATSYIDSNGNLAIDTGSSGSGYNALSVIKIVLSAYTVAPSARLQPFIVYTNDATSIDSVYSANLDSLGTITCISGVTLPFQLSSLTANSTKGIIALW